MLFLNEDLIFACATEHQHAHDRRKESAIEMLLFLELHTKLHRQDDEEGDRHSEPHVPLPSSHRIAPGSKPRAAIFVVAAQMPRWRAELTLSC